MKNRRAHRQYPRAFDDAFRSSIASVVGLIPVAVGAFVFTSGDLSLSQVAGDMALLLPAVCGYWVVFAAVYLVWTHVLYARTDPAEVRRIADVQHHRRASALDAVLGIRATGIGTVSAASVALFAAVGTAIAGIRPSAWWLLVLVLLTVACSWAGMVYAFALRYLRMDASGERITFDIDEAPQFTDFVSMSVFMSAVGALSGGTPRTRAGLAATRTHTLFAFAFNTVIVAMTVSLVVGLVAN